MKGYSVNVIGNGEISFIVECKEVGGKVLPRGVW